MARISHSQLDHGVNRHHPDTKLAAVRHRMNRVHNQIDEYLVHLIGIGLHVRTGLVQLQIDLHPVRDLDGLVGKTLTSPRCFR